jgi:hypothetical protein
MSRDRVSYFVLSVLSHQTLMSRRSTRLNLKGVKNNADLEDTLINSRSDEEDFQDVDSEEEPEPEFEPKKKRRKVAKSVVATSLSFFQKAAASNVHLIDEGIYN